MTKKAALALAIVMLVIVVWGIFFEAGSTKIIINGEELTGPLKGAIGAGGLIVGLIALFCAAIFLIFVSAGIGIFILAGIIIGGLIFGGLVFPFLLFLLLPLALVWVFVAIIRKTGN